MEDRDAYELRQLEHALSEARREKEALAYELREARSELQRHHVDFADISEMLDEFFAKEVSSYQEAVRYLQRIRNITG